MELVSGTGTSVVCPVCDDLFVEPRVLRCGHTICGQCIKHLQKPKQCPFDRSPLPDLIHELPINRFIMDMLQERRVVDAPAHITDKCPEHSSKLKYFCLKCYACVCSRCLIKGIHKGHQSQEISEMLESKRTMLDTLAAIPPKLAKLAEGLVSKQNSMLEGATREFTTLLCKIKKDIQNTNTIEFISESRPHEIQATLAGAIVSYFDKVVKISRDVACEYKSCATACIPILPSTPKTAGSTLPTLTLTPCGSVSPKMSNNYDLATLDGTLFQDLVKPVSEPFLYCLGGRSGKNIVSVIERYAATTF
jgi:hypothetical protein